MILSLLIFFMLLFLIYSLSRRLTGQLYRLLGLNGLSFFLLPGTVVHELSHMLVAEILFVKTSRFDFKPQVNEDNEVTIGRVAVTQTDPFRRTLIGLAPIISGLGLIYLIFSAQGGPAFGWQLAINFFSPPRSPGGHLGGVFILFALCYLFFTISVTMFSSRQDLEAAIVPAFFFLVLLAFFWLAGFKLTVPKDILDFIAKLLTGLNRALALVVGLNLFILFVLKGLNLLKR